MSSLQGVLLLILLLTTIVAVLLWRRLWALRRASGIPRGEVVYSDTQEWQECQPLFSARYGLSGKPDYILQQGRESIPIEVKPSRRASEPYTADVLQLAAYCLLIEDVWGERPSHGLLRYRDQTFRIPYDRSLRSSLLTILGQMRHAARQRNVSRSHDEAQRCRFCGHSTHCHQSLVD